MKELAIGLSLLTSLSGMASTNAFDLALEKIKATQDSRITQDINKRYQLEGINPDDYSKCQISLQMHISDTKDKKKSYSIRVTDQNPDSDRVNNPVVDLDLKRIQASSGSADGKLVKSSQDFIKVRTSKVIPYWMNHRSEAELSFDGNSLEVSAKWKGGPFSRSGKLHEMKSREDIREFFKSGNYNTLNYLRPSDEIRCNFDF